jgi:hypothetical protein
MVFILFFRNIGVMVFKNIKRIFLAYSWQPMCDTLSNTKNNSILAKLKLRLIFQDSQTN